MTHNSGDLDDASGETSLPIAGGDEDLEIRLIRALVVDVNPATRDEIIRLSQLRGHQVSVAGSLGMDQQLGGDPVELLLARLPDDTCDANATEQMIRRLLLQFRDDGIVAVGVTAPDVGESRLARWLNAGVHGFVCPGNGSNEAQLLAAEHRIRQNRADIREQKRIAASLKRYEALYLNSPDAQIIATPRDNRILDASLSVHLILGWRREELIGRYLSLALPNLFRKKNDLIQAGEKATRLGQSVTVSRILHHRPDGSQCLLDARVASVPWADDEAWRVTFADVTISRARQQRRIRSAKLDTIGCMAGGVADDVNNLLTAMRGSLSMIGKQPALGHDARELLHDAESACESADNFVARLRTLSRSNLGASPQAGAVLETNRRRRVTELDSLLKRAVSFELFGTRIQPSYELDAILWRVEIDESQIEQALRAIVANAKDAMPSGGSLRVLATNFIPPANSQDCPASYVLISIVDDGHGVPEECIGKVFDPYFSTRTGRAGIGLALSQAIIRSHGGVIDLEHAPPRGTVARIYLPATTRQASTESGAQGIPTASATSATSTDPIRRRRVLVMDDDKDIRIITRKILESHGFDVFCACDGGEAIEVFQKARQTKSPFDVALFDLDVRGGMGGKDAVARLRRDHPDIKVILMTGFVDDILLENHREHGFSGVITKPFQIDNLIATITQFANAGKPDA